MDRGIGFELLEQIVGLELRNVETEYADHADGVMCIRFKIDEEDVATSAFGLIFALGVLSFHDARPRGMSEMDFKEKDEWHVADMLRCIRFEDGILRFYADYVRGRMVKTSVDVHKDGTVQIQTVGRARVAERWIACLQGKRLLEIMDRRETGQAD
ncbi:MAG: hypothetical protein Q9M13_02305 [Mariprofundales bacterium]|nr:hypothetical protein [Mariprofundales bacterium]